MMKRSPLILTALILAVSLAATGCGKRRDVKNAFPVEAERIARGDIFERLFYVGDIKAENQVYVYPKVSGKLLENTVKEQDVVKKDSALAYIDRDEVGYQFEKAPVESPIDGVVGKVYLDKGENVTTNTIIAQVVAMDEVKVRIDVVERDLPKVRAGEAAKIRVDAYPDETFGGKVERVSPVVDLASRTAMVEIGIPNGDHRLKPGMFARVEVSAKRRENALIISRDAIAREDSSNYVYVIGADNIARRQKIELGISHNNTIEVTSGLQEGDLVITMASSRLRDGDKVEVVKMSGLNEAETQKE